MLNHTQTVEILTKIKGAKMQHIFRCLDMLCLGFGDLTTGTDEDGKEYSYGAFRFHIQTSFRITEGNKILTTIRDIYTPANEEEAQKQEADEGFISVFDEAVKNILEKYTDEHITDVFVSEFYDLTIKTEHLVFSVFVFDSYDDPYDDNNWESWRFMEREEKHLVVYGSGGDR